MGSLVQIAGDRLSCNVESVEQAKLAIKELKILKRGYVIKKKLLSDQIKAQRFEYSQEVKRRGSMMRGGGGIGRFVRSIQSISRDSKRAKLASALDPLENAKQEIESIIAAIDVAALKLEVFIHDRSVPSS